MKQFRVIEKADKTFILKEENVIEAIANFLADAGMLEEHETEGKMTYKMNKDALDEMTFEPVMYFYGFYRILKGF